MADTTFRLPVAGFDQIERILRAYLAAAKRTAGVPVKLDDVAGRAAMSKPAVSGNNAFLASLGLIEGGNNKQLTQRGLQAALTLDHPGTPEAFSAWSDVIDASPDLERVLDAVRIRKGMDEDALLSHIVLTAGVPKTARYLTGARTLVDVLEFAGLLEEAEGRFTVASPPEEEALERLPADYFDEAPARVRPSQRAARTESGIAPSRTAVGGSQVVLNVHVWVSASDANFDELADELKQFIARLSKAS